MFNKGDTVICITDGYTFISKGEELTVIELRLKKFKNQEDTLLLRNKKGYNFLCDLVNFKQKETTMELNDLKTGDVVVTGHGVVWRVMRDTACGDYFVGEDSHNEFEHYNESMECRYKQYNINKVYRPCEYSSHLLRSEKLGDLDDFGFNLVFDRDVQQKQKEVERLQNIIKEAQEALSKL